MKKRITHFTLGIGIMAAIYLVSCSIGYLTFPYWRLLDKALVQPDSLLHIGYFLLGAAILVITFISIQIPAGLGQAVMEDIEKRKPNE